MRPRRSKKQPLDTSPSTTLMYKSLGFASYKVIDTYSEHDAQKQIAKKVVAGNIHYFVYDVMQITQLYQAKLATEQYKLSQIQQACLTLNAKVIASSQHILMQINQENPHAHQVLYISQRNSDHKIFAAIYSVANQQKTVTEIASSPEAVESYAKEKWKLRRCLSQYKKAKTYAMGIQAIYKLSRFIPCKLKQFLQSIEALSIVEKQGLRYLLANNKSEIMFCYDAHHRHFTVSIRMFEDFMPHPTLIGEIDPEVYAAGTLDLVITDNKVTINEIRGDSGHYKIGNISVELIGLYIQQEIDPQYFGNKGFIRLRSFYGDASMKETLEIYPSAKRTSLQRRLHQ